MCGDFTQIKVFFCRYKNQEKDETLRQLIWMFAEIEVLIEKFVRQIYLT